MEQVGTSETPIGNLGNKPGKNLVINLVINLVKNLVFLETAGLTGNLGFLERGDLRILGILEKYIGCH